MKTSATISATEFKAKCLSILDRLANHEVEQVIVTKRGRPVAVLSPPAHAADRFADLNGFMRGTVILDPNVDLTDPVSDEPWDADEGVLHR